MLTEEQQIKIIKRELQYQTSRSGGKGGQNVNKVETKVEIGFDVNHSKVLSARQKEIIVQKFKDFVDESTIKITANTHRSQLENKHEAQKKLMLLLNRLLKPVKKRVATKPGKAAKEKKLKNKKIRGEKKQTRKRITDF